MEKTVCLRCDQPSGRSGGCGRKTGKVSVQRTGTPGRKAGRCPSKREAGETGSAKQDWHGNRKQPADHLYPGPDQTVL